MCLFCRIVSGEIPSRKVFENEHALAFIDIQPVNLGHVLVVPKRHAEHCLETPDDDMKEVIAASKRVAAALVKATGATGFNLAMNCGADAGQVVFHTHMHVIPRFADDGLVHWPKRPVTDAQLDDVAMKIVSALE